MAGGGHYNMKNCIEQQQQLQEGQNHGFNSKLALHKSDMVTWLMKALKHIAPDTMRRNEDRTPSNANCWWNTARRNKALDTQQMDVYIDFSLITNFYPLTSMLIALRKGSKNTCLIHHVASLAYHLPCLRKVFTF